MTPDAKCPFCKTPITIWTVLKAPMPWAIRCVDCGKKIRVRNVGIYLAAYILIAVVLCAGLVIARRREMISSAALIIAASSVILRRASFVKPDGESNVPSPQSKVGE